MIPLSERINLELRHRSPAEVTELILDTSKSDKIEGLTDEYVNLRELSLVNVGLKSLAGFPSLPNLEKLDLSDNRISGNLNYLKSCPNLNQLLLTSNRIRNIDELKPLCNLPALEILELCNCDVTKLDNYRTNVFQLLPQLIYLDGFDRNEAEESDYEDYEDYEVEDHNDDYDGTNAKFSYTSGKKGKFMPHMVNYQGDDDGSEYLHFTGGEDDDSACIVGEGEGGGERLFETYNSHYYDEYTDDGDEREEVSGCGAEENTDSCDEEEEEGEGQYQYCPPTHGSKFVPSPVQRPALKRSYSSNDDYDTSKKIFLQDTGIGFIPSHD